MPSLSSIHHLWASSVSGTRKNQWGPDLRNMVAATSSVCCFWPKNRAQATMCEQGRYRGDLCHAQIIDKNQMTRANRYV